MLWSSTVSGFTDFSLEFLSFPPEHIYISRRYIPEKLMKFWCDWEMVENNRDHLFLLILNRGISTLGIWQEITKRGRIGKVKVGEKVEVVKIYVERKTK